MLVKLFQTSYGSIMPTLYPHLTTLITALTNGLDVAIPVMAYANIEQVSIQNAPCVFLIPEDVSVVQTIANVRAISSFRMRQEWLILTVLKDSSDQNVTTPLITQLGEWQAQILQILMKDVLVSGGPIQVLDCPKSESIAGGAIAGKIRVATQFVFNAE